MTTTEEWLLSIRGIEAEIQGLKKSYKKALEDASSYATILEELIVKKEAIFKEVVELIERVGNAKQRDLLRFYYIEALSWEEVAERLNFSTRHVSGYLKEQALKKIEIIRESLKLN